MSVHRPVGDMMVMSHIDVKTYCMRIARLLGYDVDLVDLAKKMGHTGWLQRQRKKLQTPLGTIDEEDDKYSCHWVKNVLE